MFSDKKIISFIGARAGSKGLKNKNILDFAGKPLIEWTIQISRESRYIDETLVSTDGTQIMEVAKKAGASVPFMRPDELAGDKSSIYDALIHALKWYIEERNIKFDYIVLLQPTQPLRPKGFIDKAIEYYFQNLTSDTNTLITVKKVDPKYNLLMRANENDLLEYLFFNNKNIVNRQDLNDLFLVSGLVYIAPVDFILNNGRFDTGKVNYLVTEEFFSVDIDTQDDFDLALRNYRILVDKGEL